MDGTPWTARRGACYRWCCSEWLPAEGGMSCADTPLSLRIATLNILTDGFPLPVRIAIASKRRIAAAIAEVESLRPDVLALNEVSPSILATLLESAYIRENYWVTELPSPPSGAISPHGCIILSRLPIAECWQTQLPGMQRAMVSGVLLFGRNGRLVVSSVHTTAYQTLSNKALRERQLTLAARASQHLAGQEDGGRVGYILLGDMNLHYQSEDGTVLKTGMLDVWAETHFGPNCDNDPGYTFDARANPMICRYIPGEQRRMRLDRMLISRARRLQPQSPCRLWATRPIGEDLCVSDHFGLVCDFGISETDAQGASEAARAVLSYNAAQGCDDATYSASLVRLLLALPSHVIFLGRRLLGF